MNLFLVKLPVIFFGHYTRYLRIFVYKFTMVIFVQKRFSWKICLVQSQTLSAFQGRTTKILQVHYQRHVELWPGFLRPYSGLFRNISIRLFGDLPKNYLQENKPSTTPNFSKFAEKARRNLTILSVIFCSNCGRFPYVNVRGTRRFQ